MTKKIIFSLLCISVAFCGNGQIAMGSTDFPAAGWVQPLKKDTAVSNVSFGSKGQNRVYDFSMFTADVNDTLFYNPLTGTQQTLFPQATMGVTQNQTDILMFSKNSTAMNAVGLMGSLMGYYTDIVFNPVSKQYQFPTQYGGIFSGNSGFTKTALGSSFNPTLPVYQIRATNTTAYFDTIDGSGIVKTPLGTYDCLRQKRVEYATTQIDYKLISISPWAPYQTINDTTVRYFYLTKESKGNIISFTYDSLDHAVSASWSQMPPSPPVADFGTTFLNGLSFAFSDSTKNYPDSYHWDFGDGDTSNAQNPQHTYGSNGTYIICLTVANAGGSSTACDTLVINNLPPVADFSYSTTSLYNFTFTDQSSGFPDSYLWNFGDGNTDTVRNPTHQYATEGTYVVCLTVSNPYGSHTQCDTIIIFNHPPVATDDTASCNSGNTITVNVGNNDNDADGHTFCISSLIGNSRFQLAAMGNCTSITYSSNSAIDYEDTCYYIICDNGSPSKCDTGMLSIMIICNPSSNPIVYCHSNGVATPLDAYNHSCTNAVTLFANHPTADSVIIIVNDGGNSYTVIDDSVRLHAIYPSSKNGIDIYGSGVFTGYIYTYIDCGSSQRYFSIDITPVGIAETSFSAIKIYPNPAQDIVQIDFPGATMPYIQSIQLCDLTGRVVVQNDYSGDLQQKINLSGLDDGLYIIGLKESNGNMLPLSKLQIAR